MPRSMLGLDVHSHGLVFVRYGGSGPVLMTPSCFRVLTTNALSLVCRLSTEALAKSSLFLPLDIISFEAAFGSSSLSHCVPLL